jgi:DNA-binding response OmpR family regulator
LDKPIRILVVDDDENIRDTILAILRDEGYVADSAASGHEAIQKSETTIYNVVLLDIKLPDISGVELLTKIHETVPRTRKIMVTGFPSQENAIAALNEQADAFLVKPVDIEELLKTIDSQLTLQKQENVFSEQKVSEFIETRVKALVNANKC